jgi:hypothetical protein
MYDIIERYTTLSIARGVGFGALTVFCFVVGFSGDTVNVLRATGLGAFFISITLLIKAVNASTENYKRTEVWIMLPECDRPPLEIAPRLVADIRRKLMFRWALRAAWVTVFFLGAAVLFMLSGH